MSLLIALIVSTGIDINPGSGDRILLAAPARDISPSLTAALSLKPEPEPEYQTRLRVEVFDWLQQRSQAGPSNSVTTNQPPDDTPGNDADSGSIPGPSMQIENSDGELYTVASEEGTISVELPIEWADVRSGDWIENGVAMGTYLSASPDLRSHLAAWYSTWDTPGVFLGVSQALAGEGGAEEWLNEIDLSRYCSFSGRTDLPQGYYTGSYDVWSGCGDSGGVVLVVAAEPQSGDYVLVIESLSISEADLLVVDHVMDTFRVELSTAPQVITDMGEVVKAQVDTSGHRYEYVFATNNMISALIPNSWNQEMRNGRMIADEVGGESVTFGPGQIKFGEFWDLPGVRISIPESLTSNTDIDSLLNSIDYSQSCIYDGRYDHSHNLFGITYRGRYDLWLDCGGTGTIMAVVGASSDLSEQLMLAEFQALDDADARAFAIFLNSFVIGDATLLTLTEDVTVAETVAEMAGDEAVVNDSTLDRFFEVPDYVQLSDATGTLTATIPGSWVDTATGDWIVNGTPHGQSISASTNLASYENGWDTPGLFLGASDELGALGVADLLTFFDFQTDCNYGERVPYTRDNLSGFYDIWQNCGGLDNSFIVLVVKPIDSATPVVLLNILQDGTVSTEQVRRILNGFEYSLRGSQTPTFEDRVATPIASPDAFETNTAPDDGQITTRPSDEETSEIDFSNLSEGAQTPPSVSTAEIVVNALNVRAGPGIGTNRVGIALGGDELTVLGTNRECTWLQVITTSGTLGWISGGNEYVALRGQCADLPVVDTGSVDADAIQQSPTGVLTDQNPIPAPIQTDQGCYLFQNMLTSGVSVTLTRASDERGIQLFLGVGAEEERCLAPDTYTYRLDASPPWGTAYGELQVNAGDRYLFPIRAEE